MRVSGEKSKESRRAVEEEVMPSPSEIARQDEPHRLPPGSVVEYACGRRERMPRVSAYCPDCGATLARVLVDASAGQPCGRRDPQFDFPCPD